MPDIIYPAPELLCTDYRSVPIDPDSVVYCDIPYLGTEDYKGPRFDHSAFYDWASRQSVPVFISSSYEMPRDRFRLIAEFQHNTGLDSGAKRTYERVFVPLHQYHQPEDLFS